MYHMVQLTFINSYHVDSPYNDVRHVTVNFFINSNSTETSHLALR